MSASTEHMVFTQYRTKIKGSGEWVEHMIWDDGEPSLYEIMGLAEQVAASYWLSNPVVSVGWACEVLVHVEGKTYSVIVSAEFTPEFRAESSAV